MSGDEAAGGGVMHELFLPDERGESPDEVGWVHVARREAGGLVYCPRLFAAEELPDVAALHQAFGGGTYEVIARTHDRARITARRRIVLPGRPLPLLDDATPGDPAHETRSTSTSTSGGGGGGGESMADRMLMLMMQQQATMTTAMMQAFAGLASAIAGRPASAPDPASSRIVEVLAKQSAEDRRATLSALEKLAERSGGGGGANGGGFAQGFELAQLLAQGQGGPVEAFLGGLGQAVAGGAMGNGAPPNGAGS